jgi:hypothetical protein
MSRVKVVGPALLVGALFSAKVAWGMGGRYGWGLDTYLSVWVSVLAGPFAGLWATNFWDWPHALIWALTCGVAIAAHPIRPGGITGLLSTIGVIVWIFWGLALTYEGV